MKISHDEKKVFWVKDNNASLNKKIIFIKKLKDQAVFSTEIF